MAKNKKLANELKGLGSDLSSALKRMAKSQEFKHMRRDVATGIRSIAKSVGQALKTANKSQDAAKLRRRFKRVVKASRTEGQKEAARAHHAALEGIRKIRKSIRKVPRQ